MKKKFLLTTPGTFHYFDLAKALYKKKQLTKIVTGYPLFKLKKFNLPNQYIKSFSFYQIIMRIFLKFQINPSNFFLRNINFKNFLKLDEISSNYLDQSQIFLALSGTGLNTGIKFRKHNKIYICERASSHISFAINILKKEYKKFGINYEVDRKIIDREIEEYKSANFILVPSRFVQKTFEQYGLYNTKIINFASNNKIFYFKKKRNFHSKNFKIIFVGALSLRKGVHYLVEAFNQLKIKNIELHLIGSNTSDFKLIKDKFSHPNIFLYGHKTQSEINDLLNKSHLFVMPSLEEGAAISVAQAMYTGLPVIVTENTGWKENVNKYNTGYVVRPMNSSSIQKKIYYLYNHRSKLEIFSKNSLKFSKNRNWDTYVKDLNKLIKNI